MAAGTARSFDSMYCNGRRGREDDVALCDSMKVDRPIAWGGAVLEVLSLDNFCISASFSASADMMDGRVRKKTTQ